MVRSTHVMTAVTILTVVIVAAVASGCAPVGDRVDSGGAVTGAPPRAPLGPFEDELVGTWRRFHRYDESEQHYVFNADRTGEKYEVQRNGSRSDVREITYWALEDQGDHVFRIRMAGPQIADEPEGYLSDDEFHFVTDEIRVGGYPSLTLTRR